MENNEIHICPNVATILINEIAHVNYWVFFFFDKWYNSDELVNTRN